MLYIHATNLNNSAEIISVVFLLLPGSPILKRNIKIIDGYGYNVVNIYTVFVCNCTSIVRLKNTQFLFYRYVKITIRYITAKRRIVT